MGSLKMYVCTAKTEPFLTEESRDIEQTLKLFPELSNGNKGLHDLTALQVAAAFTKKGVPPIIRQLVRCGNINQGDQLGRTPLHYSALNGNVELLEFLLESGANPECRLSYHGSALRTSHENYTKWNQLYTMLPPPDSSDGWGNTPLHLAAKQGHAEAVKLLIRYMTNVNVENDKGVTPLLLVGCCKNKTLFEETVKNLVENGADVNRTCVTGTSALFHAVIMESTKATEILLNAGAWISRDVWKETELHKAAANGLMEILQKLLADSRITVDDINKSDECGRTPVYMAAHCGHRECLRLLIDNGGNLGYRNAKTKETVMDALFNNIARPAEFITDILDSKINSNKLKPNGENYNITLDFRILAPLGNIKQMQVIYNLIFAASVREKFEILRHPLIESYLRIKWAHIRQFFFLLIYLFIAFVLSLSMYVIIVVLKSQDRNDTNVFYKVDVSISRHINVVADVFRGFLIFTSAGLLTHALLQIALLPRSFIRQYELWMNICCTTISLVVSIFYKIDSNDNQDVPNWVLHTTSVAVLLAWTELMLLFGRFPHLGYYALMFSVVLQNAVKVLLTFMCLVIGFTLSFSIQFHNYGPFKTPWRALVKTTVMMMGEYEYAGIFSDEKEDDFKGLPFTSRAIFSIFVVVAGIVLMNLMVGLAVKDIQILEQEGHVRRLEKQAEFIWQLEKVISLKIIEAIWLPGWLKRFLVRKRSIATTLVIQSENSRGDGKKCRWHKNLPYELVGSIKEIATRNDGDDDDYILRQGDMFRLIDTLQQLLHNCGRRASVISRP